MSGMHGPLNRESHVSRVRTVRNAARLTAVAGAAALTAALCVATPGFSHAQEPAKSAGQSQDINSKRVTLNLENADIRYALKLLFQSAGANYTLGGGVQGTVTASLSDVPFRTALESLLKSVQSQSPLIYRVENGVYNVTLKQEEGRIVDSPRLPEEPARKPFKVAAIQINYADPADITAALGGVMLESRLGRLAGAGLGSGGFGSGQGARQGGGQGNTGGSTNGSSGIGIVNLGSGLGQFGSSGNQSGASGTGLLGNFGSGNNNGGGNGARR